MKRSCSEIWEVIDQQISTGFEFLSRISIDFFKTSLVAFEAVVILLQVQDCYIEFDPSLVVTEHRRTTIYLLLIKKQLKNYSGAKSRMCHNILKLFPHELRALRHK